MVEQIELTADEGNALRAVCEAQHKEPHWDQPQPQPSDASAEIARLEAVGMVSWKERSGWELTRLGAMWMQVHR